MDINLNSAVSVILTCHNLVCENYNEAIHIDAYPNEDGSIWAVCGPCGGVIDDIFVLVD